MSTSYLISASYTWGQFTPVFFLAGLAILLLLADAFLSRLSKQAFPLIAAIGCFLATCGMVTGPWKNPYGMLAAGSAALCLLLAFDYRTVVHASVAGGDREEGSGELSILMLLATAGVVALTRARDLIMLFVSLETITLSSYALAGYFRRNRGSVEAGVKYLVLGAVSTGILVMGIAWFFGTTGTSQRVLSRLPSQTPTSASAFCFHSRCFSLGFSSRPERCQCTRGYRMFTRDLPHRFPLFWRWYQSWPVLRRWPFPWDLPIPSAII